MGDSILDRSTLPDGEPGQPPDGEPLDREPAPPPGIATARPLDLATVMKRAIPNARHYHGFNIAQDVRQWICEQPHISPYDERFYYGPILAYLKAHKVYLV